MKEIFERRSYRKFIERPVDADCIKRIIKAGMAAPSASNSQEWEFIVVDDRQLLELISSFHEFSFALKSAPVAIIVLGNTKKQAAPVIMGNEQAAPTGDWWVQDCSAAAQNMLLEATHLGIGSIWLGIHPYEYRSIPIASLLKLPEGIIPFAAIALGYPNKWKEPNDRYDESIVFANTYGNKY